MERCEGYYRLENRRCDRAASQDVRATDGQFYSVCDHHAREARAAAVAHWNGQTDVRRPPTISLPVAHFAPREG